MQFSEYGKSYRLRSSDRLFDVQDRLAFQAVKNGKSVIILNGEELGSEYDWCYPEGVVDGELLYSAMKKSERRTYLILGHKIVWSIKGERRSPLVFFWRLIGDKLYWTSCGIGYDKETLFCNGKAVTYEDYKVVNILDLGGTPGFIIRKSNDERQGYSPLFLVVVRFMIRKLFGEWETALAYNGRKIWLEHSRLPNKNLVKIVDGAPVFMENRKGKVSITHKGKLIAGYDRIGKVAAIRNMLAFGAKLNGRWIVVFDGKQTGQDYDVVHDIVDVGGKVAFKAHRNRKWLVHFNGKDFGQEYDSIRALANVCDKLIFIGRKNQKDALVVNGIPVAEGFDEIVQASCINGKIAFNAKKAGKWVMWYDGNVVASLDKIFRPYAIGKKLAFMVNKSGKISVLLEKSG